jgi:hypothetical protein
MNKEKITTNTEIICEACGWAIVTEALKDCLWVMDQDGGYHEIGFGNIIHVYPK